MPKLTNNSIIEFFFKFAELLYRTLSTHFILEASIANRGDTIHITFYRH